MARATNTPRVTATDTAVALGRGRQDPNRGSRLRSLEETDKLLSREDVNPLGRPMSSGPKDRWVGDTELGKVYETVTGVRYTVSPNTQIGERSLRGNVADWLKSPVVLPSKEQVWEGVKSIPRVAGAVGKEIVDSAGRVARSEGTLQEALEFTPAMAAPGILRKVAKATDEISSVPLEQMTPDELDALWRNSAPVLDDPQEILPVAPDPALEVAKPVAPTETPKWPKGLTAPHRTPKGGFDTQNPKYNPLVKEPDFTINRTPVDYKDGPNRYGLELNFYNPILSTVEAMEFGKKGLTGTNISKFLEKRAPNVRTSLLRGTSSGREVLKPTQRYTKEEALDTLAQASYTVTAREVRPKWEGLQLQGAEWGSTVKESYGEIILDANRPDLPIKPAQDGHYNESTLGHARYTIRETPNGTSSFLLVEELQSDLLTGGFTIEKKKDIAELNSLIQTLVPKGLSQEQRDFLEWEVASTNLSNDEWQTSLRRFTDKYGTTDSDDPVDIYWDLQATYRKELGLNEWHLLVNKAKEIARSRNTGIPPVESVGEVVRPLVYSLMAAAKEYGVDKVVFPNAEDFLKVRAHDMSDVEKSGKKFKAIYNDSVNKVLKELEREQGVDVRVTNIQGPTGGTARVLSILNFPEGEVRFAEGGAVTMDEQMNQMRIDPVSGNEVPPGSSPIEVRDNIDAKVSEGEYIVPADVVEYFGLKTFEDMRTKAKLALQRMAEDGRIGGEPSEPDVPSAPQHHNRLTDDSVSDTVRAGLDDVPPEVLAQLPPEALDDGLAAEADHMFSMGGFVERSKDLDSLLDKVRTLAAKDGGLANMLKERGIEIGQKGKPNFAKGGAAFNPSNYQYVGQTLSDSGTTAATNDVVTYVTYTNSSGHEVSIKYLNGKPAQTVPSGYYVKGTQPDATKTEEAADNRDPEDTGPRQNYYDMDMEDLAKVGENNQGGFFNNIMGNVGGGLVGGFMKRGNIANVRAAALAAEKRGNSSLAETLNARANKLSADSGNLWSGGLLGGVFNSLLPTSKITGVSTAQRHWDFSKLRNGAVTEVGGVVTDGSGNPVLDANGNPVRTSSVQTSPSTSAVATSPTPTARPSTSETPVSTPSWYDKQRESLRGVGSGVYSGDSNDPRGGNRGVSTAGGDPELYGGGGNNTLAGGADRDTLSGGAGYNKDKDKSKGSRVGGNRGEDGRGSRDSKYTSKTGNSSQQSSTSGSSSISNSGSKSVTKSNSYSADKTQTKADQDKKDEKDKAKSKYKAGGLVQRRKATR